MKRYRMLILYHAIDRQKTPPYSGGEVQILYSQTGLGDLLVSMGFPGRALPSYVGSLQERVMLTAAPLLRALSGYQLSNNQLLDYVYILSQVVIFVKSFIPLSYTFVSI